MRNEGVDLGVLKLLGLTGYPLEGAGREMGVRMSRSVARAPRLPSTVVVGVGRWRLVAYDRVVACPSKCSVSYDSVASANGGEIAMSYVSMLVERHFFLFDIIG